MPLKQAHCRNLEYSWFSRDVRKKLSFIKIPSKLTTPKRHRDTGK